MENESIEERSRRGKTRPQQVVLGIVNLNSSSLLLLLLLWMMRAFQ